MSTGRAARDCFAALYREHADPLLDYALRRVARPEDAADVVADTMLVAWRRLADVPAGHEARLWLFGVARRVLANHRRGQARRDRLGRKLRFDLARQLQAHGTDDTPVGVQEALAKLREDDRELLRLTAWEGLGPGDIAVVMGLSPEVVRARLHRARQRLRRHLEPALSAPSEESA